MKNFSLDMTIDQILAKMDKNEGNTEIIHAGPCFLQYRLHREILLEQQESQELLLKQQQDFHEKSLRQTTCLVAATWLLVIATLLLPFLSEVAKTNR